MTKSTAERIGNHFVECIIAPGFEDGALTILSEKKNRRMLTLQNMSSLEMKTQFRQIDGGWLAQTEGAPVINWSEVRCVTSAQADPNQVDLAGIWCCCMRTSQE